MALTPIDSVHALQIQAGTLGRKAGHAFEDNITQEINSLVYPINKMGELVGHVFTGSPGTLLLAYICTRERLAGIQRASAISTGALATSEEGKKYLAVNGVSVARCKSDLVISILSTCGRNLTIGISTKQCNNPKPTNAQLYFTTARGFATLLQKNGLKVSEDAVFSLRQFCGDAGFRPADNPSAHIGRQIDPRRYFWEEVNPAGRIEWERLFSEYQDQISRLLLQKAYLDDPFVPDYILHKTKFAPEVKHTEVAIYSVEELIARSRSYQGFSLRPYSVNKGSYPDPVGVSHLAPRFGVIQMQRGGQAQHPEQLQFNLEAGYFYKI